MTTRTWNWKRVAQYLNPLSQLDRPRWPSKPLKSIYSKPLKISAPYHSGAQCPVSSRHSGVQFPVSTRTITWPRLLSSGITLYTCLFISMGSIHTVPTHSLTLTFSVRTSFFFKQWITVTLFNMVRDIVLLIYSHLFGLYPVQGRKRVFSINGI